ncbi:MAG: HAMP domain-containing histidine kinase [Planctomycetales bacterium]|nr:HAMP domain-containing histidine kinase [Planctomycetales bacterium]
MTPPLRRRLALAIAAGLVIVPAGVLAMLSLLSLSREGSRLAAEEAAARRARVEAAVRGTAAKLAASAERLRGAAALPDPARRAAALRAAAEAAGGLVGEPVLVSRSHGPGAPLDGPGLVPPPDPGPTDEAAAAALAPGWGKEFSVPPDPAAAAVHYRAVADDPGTPPGLAARALASAARASLAAGRPAEALQYADALLGGPLRSGEGGAWLAYPDDGGLPLAVVGLVQKVRALSALLARPAPPFQRGVWGSSRDDSVSRAVSLLVREKGTIAPAQAEAALALLEENAGAAVREVARARRAEYAEAALAREAAAALLADRPGVAGLVCASARPLRLLVVAPAAAGAGGPGGVAAWPVRPEALAAAFAEAASVVGAPGDEAYRVLGPGGEPLPGQGATPAGEPAAEAPFPGELGVLRGVVHAAGPGAAGAVGTLTRRLYVALSLATVAALGGGLFLIVRLVAREVRLARLQADFVSGVTHELRTPLTSIQMFVETLLLGRVEGAEETRECLETIGREAGRLRRMIDRVLDFARTERGDRVFQFREERVPELVEGALRLFSAAEEGNRVPVETALPASLPCVRADREAVQEVLLNLLTNAAKYSPAGSPVRVSAETRNGAVALAVSDHGIGIPPSEQERIFDGFYRGEDARKRNIPGTGIGLALSRRIARAHGGDLGVRSQVGAGATFSLTLPVAGGAG